MRQTYIKAAIRTESCPDRAFEHFSDDFFRMLHAVLGLTDEIGELAEVWSAGKKRNLDKAHFCEELGDCYWYCALFADASKIKPTNIRGSDISIPSALRKLSHRVGELANEMKRVMYYGAPISDAFLLLHFMELLNILDSLAYKVGSSPTAIQTQNLAKLKARYPDKFDAKRAIKRDTKKEKEAMAKA